MKTQENISNFSSQLTESLLEQTHLLIQTNNKEHLVSVYLILNILLNLALENYLSKSQSEDLLAQILQLSKSLQTHYLQLDRNFLSAAKKLAQTLQLGAQELVFNNLIAITLQQQDAMVSKVIASTHQAKLNQFQKHDSIIETLRAYNESLRIARTHRLKAKILDQQQLLNEFETLYFYYTSYPILLQQCNQARLKSLQQFENLLQSINHLCHKLTALQQSQLALLLYHTIFTDYLTPKEAYHAANFDKNKLLIAIKNITNQLLTSSAENKSYDYHGDWACYREQLKALRENIVQQQQQNKSIREIQMVITQSFQQLLSHMLQDTIDLLGPAPCAFAFIAFGSYARQEMLPYSDLEFALLIEKSSKTIDDYFKTLLKLLHFKVESLDESNPQAQVGFHLDEAVRPEKDTRLYGTPVQVADALFDIKQFPLEDEGGRVLAFSLLNPELLFGDASLLKTYQQITAQHLQSPDEFEEKFRHQRSALARLQYKLAEFNKRVIVDSKWDIKKDYLEFLSHPCLVLGLYYDIPAQNCADILATLVQKKLFTVEFAQFMQQALQDLQALRLRVQMHYGNMLEIAALPNTQASNKEYSLQPEEYALLQIVNHALLKPFYQALELFTQTTAPKYLQNPIEAFYRALPNSARGDFLEALQKIISSLHQHAFVIRTLSLAEMLFTQLAAIPDENGYRLAERFAYQKLQQALRTITIDQTMITDMQVTLIWPDTGNKLVKKNLHPDVIKKILDTVTGKIKRMYQSSKHDVAYIQLAQCQLYFKALPDQPMTDYAIDLLHRRLIGHGTAANLLARLHVKSKNYELDYPVLISQTLGARSLRTALIKNPAFTIDHRYYTELILVALFTGSGDGASRNYVLTNLNGESSLACIDNEQQFVEPIVKEVSTKGFNKIQFRNILFCLNQANAPLDSTVLKAFGQEKNLYNLISQWVRDVQAREALYLKLYPTQKERDKLYTQDKDNPITLRFNLREGVLGELLINLNFLQNYLQVSLQEGKIPSALDLLTTINIRLGKYYRDAFKEADPEKRFYAATAAPQASVSSSLAIKASFGYVPTVEEIEHQEKYSLQEAEKEVQCLFDFKPDFSKLIDKKGQPDINRQTLMLKALGLYAHQQLSLSHCTVLDDEQLKIVLAKSTQLQTLDLRYCPKLTEETIKYLANHRPTLQQLYISHNAGIKALNDRIPLINDYVPLTFPQLRILHIANCDELVLINIKAPELMEFKANDCRNLKNLVLLEAPKLQAANFNGCENWVESGLHIPGLRRTSKALKQLQLHRCEKVKYREYIEKTPQLLAFSRDVLEKIKTIADSTSTSIDLRYNQLGAEGAKAIAQALATNTSLTSIDLGRKQLGAKGAKAIAQALATNTSLISIDLGDNQLSAGAKAIAQALAANTSLASINLEYNQLGDEGANAIAQALAFNTSLTSIDLGRNLLGDEGAKAIAQALATNTSLTSIDLGNNQLSAEGAKAIAQALASNTSLTSIDLWGNPFFEHDIEKFINPKIKNNQQLRYQFHRAVQENNFDLVKQNLYKVSLVSTIVSLFSTMWDHANMPLHLAAQSGHREVTKLLLDAMLKKHQPIWRKNTNGKTALDLAKENNHEEIIALLVPHMPKHLLPPNLQTIQTASSLPKFTFSKEYQYESVQEKRLSEYSSDEELPIPLDMPPLIDTDDHPTEAASASSTTTEADPELQQAIDETIEEAEEQEYKVPTVSH